MSCDIASILKPKYMVCEMTPEHEHSSSDYCNLVSRMQSMGYKSHVSPRLNSYECGDATSRGRFVAVFISDDVPRAANFSVESYPTQPTSGATAHANLLKLWTICVSNFFWRQATDFQLLHRMLSAPICSILPLRTGAQFTEYSWMPTQVTPSKMQRTLRIAFVHAPRSVGPIAWSSRARRSAAGS